MSHEIDADIYNSLIDPASGAPAAGAALGALLTAHAMVTPAAPALTIDGETRDYAAIDAAANRRARALAKAGVGRGDTVLIALPNDFAYFEFSFALWKIGAVPCAVSAHLTAAEFQAIAELAAPRLIVAAFDLPDLPCPVFRGDAPIDRSFSAAPLAPLAHAPGKIATSGGSTGRPKLIVDPCPSAWGPDKETVRRAPRSIVLNPGPLYHSAPFNLMHMALAQGCHVICMRRFDPDAWLDLVERYRVDWAYLVPTMMARIARLPAERAAAADLTSLDTMLHMAAPCPAPVKRWWIDRIGADRVWEVYGGTERIGATTIGGTEWLEHPGSVGRARSGQEIVITGDDGRTLPPGEIGEIHFRKAEGPGTAYRYIGAESRISGELDSFGDMGWLDGEGYLFIADRRTDMILSGGVNLYPAEIEAAVEAMPGVRGCAVIGLPDADLGQRVHAIVEWTEGAPPAETDFLADVAARLSGLKRPRSVEFTVEPIRNEAGKVRRSALREARLQDSTAIPPHMR